MDDYEKAALNWANSVRDMQGLVPLDKLPRGKRGSKLNCPLAIATRRVMNYKDTPNLTVLYFMSKFDDGEYKHLIKHWWNRGPLQEF